MPQGRKKVPFSGKKKKEQLAAKRQERARAEHNWRYRNYDNSDGEKEVEKVTSHKYTLQFQKESKKEIEAMKEEARKPLQPIPIVEQEVDSHCFNGYNFPTRPEWNYDMSKEELDRNERRYFTEYIDKMQTYDNIHFGKDKPLSIIELNLETWRQLWRVLELSDVFLVIVDARYGALMFPPSLYEYITRIIKKKLIILLNKIDLVPSEVVLAWKSYFSSKYPDSSVICFASYPIYKVKGRKRINLKFASRGAYSVYKVCQDIVGDELDISKWEEKILEDMQVEDDEFQQKIASTTHHEENYEFDFTRREKYKDGILTIGCIGFPNVGKSSVINALKGRKVVSISRTPGHTKHFQTIFLTDNVKLCDCPGLVFPSSVPKPLQVILGSYPIAHLRVPYPSIKYVAERVDLVEKLKIQLPPDYEEWSAMAICEAWAIKRGFYTAKASRPDVYRAANHILRLTLDGSQITVVFYPPHYFQNEEMWKSDKDLEDIKNIQGEPKNPTPGNAEHESEDSFSEEEAYNNESESDEEQELENEEADDESEKVKATTSKMGKSLKGGHNPFDILDEE